MVKITQITWPGFFKVYMTDFFLICLIKSPQCTDKYSKEKFSIGISFLVFWCTCTKSVKFHFQWGTKSRDQKQETGNNCDIISGLQGSRKTDFSDIFLFLINNALFYHFLVHWLAHNKKMTEKSVFRKALSPEMTSHLFPVSCF